MSTGEREPRSREPSGAFAVRPAARRPVLVLRPQIALRGRLAAMFGLAFWGQLRGKVVVDYGCGDGRDAMDMAQRGAGHVIGYDVRPAALEAARREAEAAALNCEFTDRLRDGSADVIVSVNTFQHFADPAGALEHMARVLRPDGSVFAAFGPPWLHPYGGRALPRLPWSHLALTHEAVLRWTARVSPDLAARLARAAGDLNRLTIARFEGLVAESALRVVWLETVPIGGWRPLVRLPGARELFTSLVRCELRPRQ